MCYNLDVVLEPGCAATFSRILSRLQQFALTFAESVSITASSLFLSETVRDVISNTCRPVVVVKFGSFPKNEFKRGLRVQESQLFLLLC